MTEYLVPFEDGESEFVEKRSRFISHIWRVETEADARARIEEMKKKYYDARHNCWCYLLKEGNVVRYSDDGEPQGTAGQPMLNVFQRQEVTNVCCVVTRYFGGILLGAGGLTRAYQNGVKEALALLPVTEKKVLCRGLVEVDYAHVDRFYRLLPQYQARVVGEDFGSSALFTVELPEDLFDPCRDALREATDGASEMMDAGPETEDI